MTLSTPQRPWRLAVVGVLGWLVFTLIAAFVDGETVAAQAARDGSRAAAAAFLTLAIGGGLLQWWQRREWQRRTQWVAVDLLDRAMRRLATLTAAAFDVASASVPGTEASVPLSQVFCLRWSPVKDRAIREDAEAVTAALNTRALADWGGLPAAAGTGPNVTDSAGAVDRLQASADDLWDAVREVSGYLDDRQGPALLTAASDLHAAVRGVADPVPGDQVPPQFVLPLVATQLGSVVEGTAGVARELDAAYGAVRRHISDETLLGRLDKQEQRCSEHDEEVQALLDARLEAMAIAREAQRAGADLADSGEAFLAEMRQLLDAPDLDAETLRLVRDALDQVGRITDELDQGLRDEGHQPSS